MKNIAAALVKAQINFEKARKSSKNPHFKSNYAALDVCVDAVRDALNNEGIFLSQPCHECADGVIVETVFLHSSGEMFSAGKLHVPAAKNDPQGYGSALTYARRYSLLAACGIAPEDDDGNAASKNTKDEELSKSLAAYDKNLSKCETIEQLEKTGKDWSQVIKTWPSQYQQTARDSYSYMKNKLSQKNAA